MVKKSAKKATRLPTPPAAAARAVAETRTVAVPEPVPAVAASEPREETHHQRHRAAGECLEEDGLAGHQRIAVRA